jgi:hypothetical protein
MDKPMAEFPYRLRNVPIFGPKDINRSLRVDERGERLRVVIDLNAHRDTIFRQKIKRPRVIPEINPLVALHALFSREPFILGWIHALAGP